MEKSSTSGARVPVLIKKGEPIPENAIQLSDEEILNIQNKRIEQFQPKSEMKIFNYSQHALGASVAASGYLITSIVRKNFRLGGLKVMLTYGPAIAIPSIFSVVLHEFTIKNNILLGREPCPTCVSLRSGVVQALNGLCYPYVLSVLSCLPVAREFYTLPMPATQKGIGYLRLLRHVSPTSSTLLGIGLLNMFIGMEVARRELKLYLKYFSKPPSPPSVEDTDMLNEWGSS